MNSGHTGPSKQAPALFGALLASAVAPLLINTIPAINAVLTQDLHVGPAMLGTFSSADAGGIATGALSAAVLTRRSSPRTTILAGLVLNILANLLSAATDWGIGTLVLRILGGIGTGLSLSACNYVFGFGNTERNYASSMLSLMGLSAIFMALTPILNSYFGWRGLFLALALLSLPALVLAPGFPRRYDNEPPTGPSLRVSPLAKWIGLSAVTLATLGQIAFFTFLASVGDAAGFARATVETSLSFCGAGAFLGAVLSLTLGSRSSSMVSIALIVVLDVVGVGAAASHSPWIYTVGISAFYCSIPLYATGQFGLLMRRAPSQSFAVSISAAQFLGTALAPSIGAGLIEHAGYELLEAFTIAAALSAYALLVLYVVACPPSVATLAERPTSAVD
jgi:predicted MFS family arabinose efflux permease